MALCIMSIHLARFMDEYLLILSPEKQIDHMNPMSTDIFVDDFALRNSVASTARNITNFISKTNREGESKGMAGNLSSLQ